MALVENGYGPEPMEVESHWSRKASLVGDGPHKDTGARPPAEFRDPSNIVPPQTMEELIGKLHQIFAADDISVEYVQALMTSFKAPYSEWKKFAKFDPHRYTRNLVNEGNGKFNLMLLCWNEAQGSSIHSHANSHCFLKVLKGTVKEERFEWPDDCANKVFLEDEDDDPDEVAGMKKFDELECPTGSCAYINDSLGLHRVENPSHIDKAVTLHLYSPPFDECQCFDERTGRAITSKVTFWSKFGKRTPFGRNPDSCMSAENN